MSDAVEGDSRARPRRRDHLGPRWAWLVGLATGLVVMGPALAPGSLFNLDLVVSTEIFVPDSLWGLGPSLPRRGPLYAVLALASKIGGGAGAWKILAVLAVATAFAGVVRRTEALAVPVRIGAGWGYALSPFLLTRVGVGHLGLVLAMALLPYALPVLARPGRHLGTTFLWAVALSMTGVYGVLLAGPLLVGGLLGATWRTWLRVGGVIALGQTWWALPGLMVLRQGGSIAGGAEFPPSSFGPGGYVRLLAGHGFWQPAYQVGILSGWVVPLGGVAMVALAVLGHRHVVAELRRPLAVGAIAGMGSALLPVAPGLDGVHDWLTTETLLAGPLRESQRLLALFVLWVVVAGAHGAAEVAVRLGRRSGHTFTPAWALPGLVALALGSPGLWAIGGQLEPVTLPEEWGRARSAIDRSPGTVLALPWTEFFDLPIADDRRVVHPVPYVFGGDVIVAADPKLGAEVSESVDPRLRSADAAVDTIRRGGDVSDQLADLGVRWIVLVVADDVDTYDALDHDRGLEHVVAGDSLHVWHNERWRAPIVTADGDGSVTHWMAPLARTDVEAPGTWARPGGHGWVQGWTSAVGTAENGLAAVPGGSGVLWYWPAVVVLFADGVVAIAVIRIARRLARRSSA